jgi:pyruvate dehydrogenase E1 component alpha subunit
VLRPTDHAFGAHRSHGHYLAKGGRLKPMLAELYGKATGCCGGKGGSMHLVDVEAGFLGATPIVGSTIPIAVGAAFASAVRGEDRVTVVFFGEGATEEGVFHEAISFAALRNLPVVFVCENNLYSVYSPLAVRQPEGRDVCRVAEAACVKAAAGDGNDVVEVREVAAEAVERARRGEGPTLLEFRTYRWREHCGPFYDNDLGYRSEEEFREWSEHCPVEGFRRLLLGEGILSDEDADRFAREVEAEVEDAVRFAKESPFPEEDELATDVYGD